MADLITADEVRDYLRGVSGITGGDLGDDELVDLHIAAVVPVIEDLSQPVASAERERMVTGGGAVISMPWAFSTVVSIVENGTVLSPVDYYADGAAGLIYRGSTAAAGSWASGTNNITVRVATGATVIPGNVKLAALELFRHLWSGRNGASRPGIGGQPSSEMVYTPSGFAVPHRVAELLIATPRLPGFA